MCWQLSMWLPRCAGCGVVCHGWLWSCLPGLADPGLRGWGEHHSLVPGAVSGASGGIEWRMKGLLQLLDAVQCVYLSSVSSDCIFCREPVDYLFLEFESQLNSCNMCSSNSNLRSVVGLPCTGTNCQSKGPTPKGRSNQWNPWQLLLYWMVTWYS